MVMRCVPRRSVLAGLAAAPFAAHAAGAEEVVDLTWNDLLPKGEDTLPAALAGLIDHDTPPRSSEQPASSGVRSDWNGRIVRLPCTMPS